MVYEIKVTYKAYMYLGITLSWCLRLAPLATPITLSLWNYKGSLLIEPYVILSQLISTLKWHTTTSKTNNLNMSTPSPLQIYAHHPPHTTPMPLYTVGY